MTTDGHLPTRPSGSPASLMVVVAVGALAVAALAIAVLLSLAACGAQSPPSTEPQAGKADAQKKAVEFVTSDGVTLAGYLFGTGEHGVVLAHMYPADQTSWFDFAAELAQRGYVALTYDFRGYGKSEGTKDIAHINRDVLAAVHALGQAGAKRLVLVGASMGGTASLMAAAELGSSAATSSEATPEVCGVITLSAPVEFRGLSAREAAGQLSCPLLFIAAEGDVGAANARELAQLSSNRGNLLIVPGDDHGTNLLRGSSQDQVRQAIMDFLESSLNKD